MKGDKTTLTKMLRGEESFSIPVYQRDYTWHQEECRQFYDDLKSTIINQRPNHFFGSIVDAENTAGKKHEYIIIDGQQRITTLSLLVLAFKNVVMRNLYKITETDKDKFLRKIDRLLYNDNEEIKLHPAPKSVEAYIALFSQDEANFKKDTDITNNYLYFLRRLEEDKDKYTADEIWDAIDRLVVIDIYLEPDDDAQLIFESINSTGVALSESDKIRNYVMMALNLKEQDRYYNVYWREIEANTGPRCDLFIRDYLTVQTRKVSKVNEIYAAFKVYARDRDNEQIIKSMLKFSRYYSHIYSPEKASQCFRERLTSFRKLDMGVADPYLMQLFEGYELGIIPENEVNETLDVLANYVFRRKICDVATNALNKIFTTLHTDALKLKGNTDDYSERIKYVLMHKEWSGRFPKDDEFIETLKTRDIYTRMKDKYKLYLFESLECFDNREAPDITALVEAGTCTIEHIMPQTLTEAWTEALGGDENATRVHSTWLHTIGNLTLTGYNSKYSNLLFEKKLSMEHGFKDSTFWLNKFIGNCEKWTEEEIIARADMLIERAKQIWPEPHSDFVENVVETDGIYNLAENYNFTNKQIVGFGFDGESYDVSSWKEFVVKLLQLLYEKDPAPLRKLSLTSGISGPSSLITSSIHDYSEWKLSKVADEIYVYTNNSTWDKLRLITGILDVYNIPATAVDIRIKTGNAVKQGMHENAMKFWEYALPKINEKSHVFQGRSPTSDIWLTAGVRLASGMRYLLYFNNTRCLVAFEFNSEDSKKNLAFYDYVVGNKEEIEMRFGAPLNWVRNENMRRSAVECTNDIYKLNDEDCWDAAVEFLGDNLKKLYDALQPVLESYNIKDTKLEDFGEK